MDGYSDDSLSDEALIRTVNNQDFREHILWAQPLPVWGLTRGYSLDLKMARHGVP